MTNTILVFAEQRDGALRKPSLEALGAGRRLAASLGGEAVAVLIGGPGLDLAGPLGAGGASKVLLYEAPHLALYSGDGYARIMADAAKRIQARALLFPASSTGADLAPRVAALLDTGLVSDCVELNLSDGNIEALRPIYAGKALLRVRPAREPFLATLRPNVFAPEEAGLTAALERIECPIQESELLARVTELLAAAGGKVPLAEARVIVSGGRGLKGPDGFKLLEELAAAFGSGATVGASRAAVDDGWRPHADQVGQTGKTVAPTLYIACGISGAIQHLAGMSSSKFIVAINKDADAPIFKLADYGIVGDLFQVVPELTRQVKARVG